MRVRHNGKYGSGIELKITKNNFYNPNICISLRANFKRIYNDEKGLAA